MKNFRITWYYTEAASTNINSSKRYDDTCSWEALALPDFLFYFSALIFDVYFQPL